MKKLTALLLALVMVCSLATTAFADEGDMKTDPTTVTIKKTYVTTANGEPATFPAEVLKFTIEKMDTVDGENPSDVMISIAEQTIDANTDELTITIPEYTVPGRYNYKITEVAGNTQGVDYTGVNDVIVVQVLVRYNEAHDDLETVAYVYKLPVEDAEKVDEMVNVYDLASLSINKQITGNMSNKADQFEVTVTFTADKDIKSDITCNLPVANSEVMTAEGVIKPEHWSNGTWTETFTVTHDTTITFDNIPAGVEWKVEEADYTAGDINVDNEAYDLPEFSGDGYTEEGDFAVTGVAGEYTGEGEEKTCDTEDAIVITNNKETEVATGVVLDSAPYILMLVVAMAGVAALLSKKRYEA